MLAQTTAALWMEDGAPARLVLDGERWRVIDMPTRLGNSDYLGSDWIYALTHPPRVWAGWRFTARSESGETRVFDVRRGEADAEWRVLRSYA